MALEALAALVVGLAALGFVLAPVLWPHEAAPELPEPVDPEETRRGIALAALHEIEFDQATGKLSDEDYAMLKGKYTAQALQALRAEDGLPVAVGPTGIEAGIAARAVAIRAEGVSGLACPHCGPRPELDAVFCSTCGAGLDARTCNDCGATLPSGSRFCDQCGKRVAA